MRIPLWLTIFILSSLGCQTPTDESAIVTSQSLIPWVHYTMDDLQVDPASLDPVRARYIQTMLDLDGSRDTTSQGIVHLEVDHALHSGLWDGQYPAVLVPFRDRGLVVDWKIQNSIYNAYDRVLTDSRFSTILRQMPAGPYGILIGATIDEHHERVRVPLGGPDSSFAKVTRLLPHGALNVLTLPYTLSVMDLEVGQRFTLPGFALVGGPEGTGRRWRAALIVDKVSDREFRGERHRVVEVLQWAVDPTRIDSLAGPVSIPLPDQRFTRHYLSNKSPYFLGRGDYKGFGSESPIPIREHLDVIDWETIPLSIGDLIDDDPWIVDSTQELFRLKKNKTPLPAISRN